MLTKSNLQSLLQCPRKLWLERHRPDLLPKEDSGLSRRAMDGVIVGEKARNLLGNSFVWPRAEGDMSQAAVEFAKKHLAAAKDKPAAEVPLVHEDFYARADALIPREGGYVLRETKASTFPLKADRQTPDDPKDHYVD